MTLAASIQSLVANAFTSTLAPQGLTKTVDFHYFVSEGVYDAETDTKTPVYSDVTGVAVVACKATVQDASNYSVITSDTKLLVPGTALAKAPVADRDTVTLNGEKWSVRKTVEVPGAALYIVFIYET